MEAMSDTEPIPRAERRQRGPRRDPRLAALAESSGYEIIERIGAGGMGIVYRAVDADGQDVAIKLLRHEISEDPRARDRLAREVAAQQRVRNDSIARILDAELESGDAFVVTEFVPGPTLEEAVHSHQGLHPEAVREIGLALGEALHEIHAAGVVHRDLKPSNVLLRGAAEEDLIDFDPDGDRLDPVIIDFGIAIAAEESRLTSTGLVMGTAAYLDPEVIRTDHTGEAGDWWALAALLAFAATGREPFGRGRADLVFLRADRGEIDVEGAPRELAAWLRSALRSKPEERTPPEQLLEQLAELDLTVYEDPGPTEVLDARGRTAVLPAVIGSAHHEQPTEAISSAEAAGEGAGGDEAGGVTAQLPVGARVPTPVEAPTEAPTEALPPVTGAGAEPATEVLPSIGPPTRQMPVVADQIPPQHAPPHAPHPAAQPTPQHAPPPSAQRPVHRDPGQYLYPGVQQAEPPQQPSPQGWPEGYPAPGAGPMMAHGAWAMPIPPPPRRRALVWTGHLLLVSLAAVAPYVSLVLLLLLGAAARAWERSHRAVSAQRMRGASGSGPQWAAGLAAPFRLLQGLLEIGLQVVLPLVLGLLVGIAIDAAVTLSLGSPPPEVAVFVPAMAITLLITWVGLGSRTTRNGAHRMVDAAAPDAVWTAVLLGLLLLLLAAVVTAALAREGMVDYFPFPDGPRLSDIALWRR